MQARGSRSLLAASAAGIALTLPAPVMANGRFPQASELAFSPSDPGLVVVRTTFGLLVSHDDGLTWRWICEAAIGLGAAQEDPSYGVTQAGGIVGALWQGLAVSPDRGCNWAFAGGALSQQRIADLVVRPDDPHVVLGVTATWNSAGGGLDGAPGVFYQSQVFRSTDDGNHWSALGVPIDPSVKVTTLEVARSDPHRLYVSGTRGSGAERTAQLFVSSDDGATWVERSIPFLPAVESGVYIGAVDPANSDLVYVRTDVQSRLLVTSDAGVSFQIASFVGADGGTRMALNGYMFGFALSPDGAKIYAGGAGSDGLFVGARGSSSLVHRSDLHVACLAARGSELWACSDEASGFVAGTSDDDGATFTPRLHLDGVSSVLQCAPGSNASQCQSQFAAQCKLLGGCNGVEAGADGGAAEAGAGEGAEGGGAPLVPAGAASGPGKSACGCSAGGDGAPGSFVVISAAVLAVSRRRRRT